MAKDDGGLFPEPPRPCPHTSTHQNEHEIVCNDCGATVDQAPH